jgi:hypothetical protein
MKYQSKSRKNKISKRNKNKTQKNCKKQRYNGGGDMYFDLAKSEYFRFAKYKTADSMWSKGVMAFRGQDKSEYVISNYDKIVNEIANDFVRIYSKHLSLTFEQHKLQTVKKLIHFFSMSQDVIVVTNLIEYIKNKFPNNYIEIINNKDCLDCEYFYNKYYVNYERITRNDKKILFNACKNNIDYFEKKNNDPSITGVTPDEKLIDDKFVSDREFINNAYQFYIKHKLYIKPMTPLERIINHGSKSEGNQAVIKLLETYKP